jgi:DNA mismatch endonuclease (patch repair protein)
MADVVDAPTRSRMMAGIGGKHTHPELAVRRALHRAGFRYRLHARDLPGRPDLVLPKHRAAIFVHGCFWHRHSGCRYASTPATRREFWATKFQQNVERDARTLAALQTAGWRTAVVWECATRGGLSEHAVTRLKAWLTSDEPTFELGETAGPT